MKDIVIYPPKHFIQQTEVGVHTAHGPPVQSLADREHKEEPELVQILILHMEVLVVREHLHRARVATPIAVQVILTVFICFNEIGSVNKIVTLLYVKCFIDYILIF